MLIQFCKSKIAHAIVTEADLHYEGSITIDEDLLTAVDIVPGEQVHVLNINTGERFETYVIAGRSGLGEICLNGPAARLGLVGDRVIILSYGLIEAKLSKDYRTKIVHLDDHNKIKN